MATTRRGLETRPREPMQPAPASPNARAQPSQSYGDGSAQALRRAQPRSVSNGRRQGGLKNLNEEQLARGLGWFSIGLGLAEVLAPRGIAKLVGVKGNHTGLIRLFGLREIASGIGIFAEGKRPATSVWSRVAGDALDLTALGAALISPRSSKGRVAFATANVLGVTAVDMLCAQKLSRKHGEAKDGAVAVRTSVVIDRSPEELYRFWRDFENLPRFMYHLESVRVTDDRRSHWVANAPAGTTVEWDAEITEDRPGELIAWRSTEGADVDNSGSVSFEPATGGRGTIMRVEIDYSPPGGVIGAGVAKLFGEEPEQQVPDDLHRLKQLMETGEIIRSESSPLGRGQTSQRPAQPLPNDGGR